MITTYARYVRFVPFCHARGGSSSACRLPVFRLAIAGLSEAAVFFGVQQTCYLIVQESHVLVVERLEGVEEAGIKMW